MAKISQPQSFMTKILQLSLTVGLVIVGFIFSFVAFGLLLALGITIWLWFWWKRYQLKKQFAASQNNASTETYRSGRGEAPQNTEGGIIIEGEIVSRENNAPKLPPGA